MAGVLQKKLEALDKLERALAALISRLTNLKDEIAKRKQSLKDERILASRLPSAKTRAARIEEIYREADQSPGEFTTKILALLKDFTSRITTG